MEDLLEAEIRSQLGAVFGLKALLGYAKGKMLPSSAPFWRGQIDSGRLTARKIGGKSVCIMARDLAEYIVNLDEVPNGDK